MRKAYFLLTALLLQLVSIGAYAQSNRLYVPGDPLITDVSQLTSNASDESEGQHIEYLIDQNENTFWHSDWHGKVTDPHYLQVTTSEVVNDGYIVMYMYRRKGQTVNHLTQAKLMGSSDGETWDELANWPKLANATDGGQVATDPVAITKNYTMFRLVNTASSPIFFHAAEFQLYHVSEADMAMDVLDKLNTKYGAYADNDFAGLNTGTEFGQYTDSETAGLIKTALNRLLGWLDGSDTETLPTTLAAAEAFRDEMDGLFEKYFKSEVLYSLPADGYYRIISNLAYKQETQGEGDEAEPVVTYMKKAMFCSTDYKGMWGTVKNDMANYIWKLTKAEDGTIDMVNAGMGARFNKIGATCTLAEDGDKKVIFDFAGNENDQTVIYIREATAARGGSNYLHQNGHSRGLRVEDQPLCTWVGTFNMGATYSTDKGTSEWYLEPVDAEEAEALITAFEPIKNHDKLVEQNNTLRAEVLAAITTAKDEKQEALITSVSQMSSPWSQMQGDNAADGNRLEDGPLLDGNVNTYWHSIYQNKELYGLTEGDPYIQLSDMENMVGKVMFFIQRRNYSAGHATEFTLKGTNDENAAAQLTAITGDEWETIKVIPTPDMTAAAKIYSDPFTVDTPYKYVRVLATKNDGYFHAAELQIYKIVENPNSQFVALGELATNLEKIYNENVATEDANITIDMYNALKDAFEAFKSGMTDPSEMRKVMDQYANATNGMVEGINPGQWKSTEAYDAFQSLYNEMKDYDATGRYTQAKLDYYTHALPLAAKNFMAAANAPKTDTWYRIKFPSEALYDANHWDKANIGEGTADVQTPIWDNYVTVGEYEQAAGQAYFDYWATEVDSIREGSHLVALENDLTEENPDASYFRFVEVESPVAPVGRFNDLIATSRQALDLATTTTLGEPMIKNAKQLSSNASDETEGKNLSDLIDGDPNTFWHSDWHGAVTEPHYLQVSFDNPVSGIIEVDMTRRAGAGNGDVTRMYVTASNDGENWDRIGYIELPFVSVGERILSTPVDLGGAYTSLRFIMTKRRGFTTDTQFEKELDPFGEEYTYFHAAEFQVRPVTVTKASANAIALEKALVEANKVLTKDITAADYAPLATAYNTLQQELNTGEHKIVPAAPTKLTTYVLQNKATGLFVNTLAPNDHEVTLRLTPTIFTHTAVGFGENVLRADNIDGLFCTYLHIQRNTHQFVTWDNSTAGSNSGLMLEEVEAAEEKPELTFTKDIVYGKINAWCYPVAITSSDEEVVAYTVAGTYSDKETGNTWLALDKAEGIEAGQPVICIQGSPKDWKEATGDSPAEITPVQYTIDPELNLNLEAAAKNGLVGTLVAKHVDAGAMTFVNNTVSTVEGEAGATVEANSAYLDLAACPQVEADGHTLSIQLGSATPEGISSAVEKVSKSGDIYSTDGKLVRANGTLNDINKLGRGIYILNGVKVLVK